MELTLEEKIAKVKDFRVMDDVFFEVLADDVGVCQEMLRTILEDDALIVEDVIVQSSERNLYGRSVRLDALCVLGTGARVNIEVQRSDNDDHLKRARFNAASITVKDSNAGETFSGILDVIVIYISEFDFLGEGKTTYHIDKVIRETGTVIDDGQKEIFVNTTVDDGSDIADLMSCVSTKMVDNPKFPRLSERVHELKTTEGGNSAVCQVMQHYEQIAREEGIKQGMQQGIEQERARSAEEKNALEKRVAELEARLALVSIKQ